MHLDGKKRQNEERDPQLTAWEDYHKYYGWDVSCQGTVPPAIVYFLESEDFEDAIRRAVSIGGDSDDTLACITGGIAEAFYGGVPDSMARFTQADSGLRSLVPVFPEPSAPASCMNCR